MANPYAGGGVATTGGGNGSWNSSTTNITSVGLPTLSVIDTFTHTYNVTLAELQNICDYLWNIWTSLERYFTKADDAIVSCYILPIASSKISTGSTNNTPYYVTLGADETPYQGKLITKGYTLNCGSVTIDEYSGSFLDYDENTQISLYLPYIGTVQLDPSIVMGKTISVKYNIDVYTGNCVANVFVKLDGTTDSLVYSYNGNCAYQIATSSTNYSEAILGVISAAVKIGVAVAAAL